MKCPLLNIGQKPYDLSGEPIGIDCLKEECAWWNVPLGNCVTVGLFAALEQTEDTLELICKKMPHELQFRK